MGKSIKKDFFIKNKLSLRANLSLSIIAGEIISAKAGYIPVRLGRKTLSTTTKDIIQLQNHLDLYTEYHNVKRAS